MSKSYNDMWVEWTKELLDKFKDINLPKFTLEESEKLHEETIKDLIRIERKRLKNIARRIIDDIEDYAIDEQKITDVLCDLRIKFVDDANLYMFFSDLYEAAIERWG